VPLPPLIEIVPLTSPVRAEITVPGSKSITNRALILAALADGRTTLRGALWSEDTQVMTDCLRALGFTVDVQPDPAESCNRTITVDGLGGRLPRAGTAAHPLELFVGNAGTAARFLAAMVCLGDGVYRLSGVPRMHERPQAALFAALRELGYRVDSPNDKLPAVIYGEDIRQKAKGKSACSVSVVDSSQFASALLLAGGVGGWQVEITGANEDELPYVDMTRELVKVFPANGGEFQIEPDASSGSYFWASGRTDVQDIKWTGSLSDWAAPWMKFESDWTVKVASWPSSGWQVDAKFPALWKPIAECSFRCGTPQYDFFAKNFVKYLHLMKKVLPDGRDGLDLPSLSRERDLGDSIMTAITLGPLAVRPLCFEHLTRLRVQECERVEALKTELERCGGRVDELGQTLKTYPSDLHGAEIETYDDHRMAMCFAVLGLKLPGIKIKNPACVKKTFPNFFQKLATPPPHGLGTEIRDAATGRKLALEELFAD
jgi:3-phosphoshikimate 1-carboxyvinyltransferase